MSFQEYLAQQNKSGVIPTSQPIQQTGSFQDFMKNQATGLPIKKPDIQPPFWERQGIIQSIFSPVVGLGKDIAQMTPQYQEMKQKTEENLKFIADTLNKTDLDQRTKQIISNIHDEAEPLRGILAPRTPEQMIGDIAGTALLVATPSSFLKGLGTGIAAQAARGAVTGGLIGGAAGMSAGENIGGVLKSTAIGAGLGGVAEPLAGLAGKGLVKGTKFVAQQAKPLTEKIVPYISSVGSRLEKFGDSGKQIVKDFLDVDRNSAIRAGQFAEEAKSAGLFNLNQSERWSGQNSLLDRLEGRTLNESDNIGKAFEVADKARKEIGQEAQAKGVQVRYRGVKPFETPKAQISPKIAPEPLAQEARKYKSAEEFVKAQMQSGEVPKASDIAFHGSQAKEIRGTPNVTKGTMGEAFYLNEDPSKAVNFGTDQKVKIGDSLLRKSGAYQKSNKFTFDLSNLKIKTFKNDADFFDYVKDPNIADWFKLAGYDGSFIRNSGNYAIYNPSKLKLIPSESQLINFYNQAVGGVKETPIPKIAKGGTSKPFQPKENYFPHIGVNAEDIADNNQVFKDAIQNAVRLGKFADEKEAQQVAKAYAEFVETNGKGGDFWTKWLVKDGQTSMGQLSEQERRLLDVLEKRIRPPKGLEYPQEMVTKLRNAMDEARGMTMRYFQQSRLKKFGQLEYAREVNFPFYDPDPARVLPRYVAGATKRLETIGTFGLKGEELNRLLGSVKRIQGPDAGREASNLVKIITESVNQISTAPEKVSAFIRMLSVPKLAFSQVINLSQSVNSLLGSDLPSVANGIKSAFTNKGVANALKSGSTLESVISEVATRYGESDFASKFLKYTGFNATEKFNRTVAANTGIFWVQKNFNKLLQNPADKVAMSRLTELGINPQEALSVGRLSENDLLKAAQIFTEKTQFRARPIDLPAFVSSPLGKLFFQFKSYAFNQTKFLKNEFVKEISSGNYGRATRDFMILSLVFPVAGEVFRDIQSLATGSRRPTDALTRYFDDLSSAGGLGLLYDTLQSASIGKIPETIVGPSISSASDVATALINGIKTGKLTDSQKKTIINQFGITRPIGNYVFQTDRKGTDTFLKTLQDLFNE